jgi:hypothetical protein
MSNERGAGGFKLFRAGVKEFPGENALFSFHSLFHITIWPVFCIYYLT